MENGDKLEHVKSCNSAITSNAETKLIIPTMLFQVYPLGILANNKQL